MASSLHPAANHHLPGFISAPGETDTLMVITGVILLVSILAFGIIFLRLHTLPERLAHKTHKLQFEIVAVLGLLALLTHVHLFWVAGLLLALIDIPDFGGFLGRIANSVEKIAKPAAVRTLDVEAEGLARSSGERNTGESVGLPGDGHRDPTGARADLLDLHTPSVRAQSHA